MDGQSKLTNLNLMEDIPLRARYVSVKYTHLSPLKYSYMFRSVKTINRPPLKYCQFKEKYSAIIFTLYNVTDTFDSNFYTYKFYLILIL